MRIDFSSLTRPDSTQHYASVTALHASGLITDDEGRAMLGLPPMEGTDNGSSGPQPQGTEGLPPGDAGGLPVLPPGD
jgi:hypothetical protein